MKKKVEKTDGQFRQIHIHDNIFFALVGSSHQSKNSNIKVTRSKTD